MANFEYLIEVILRSTKVENVTLNYINHYLDVFVTTNQSEQEREVVSEKNGVQIICTTIHKSKGLEYGTVILPFTSEDISSSKKSKIEVDWVDNKLSYYIRFTNSVEEHNSFYDENTEKEEQEKEECRILYVGLTRAIRDCVWMLDSDSHANVSWSTLLED